MKLKDVKVLNPKMYRKIRRSVKNGPVKGTKLPELTVQQFLGLFDNSWMRANVRGFGRTLNKLEAIAG